jgi:putative N-acetylmannosamine-6-phosphate epimerase
MMSLKQAKDTLRPLGIRIERLVDTDEYRVNFAKADRELSAYYTDDIYDAVQTGKAMAAHTTARHRNSTGSGIRSAIKKAQQLANRTGRAYEVRTLSRSEASRIGRSLRGYVERELKRNPEVKDIENAISAGDRVTIVNRFGQRRTGRAVMRGPAGWVLNMGGPHGTPAIADNESIVKVVKGGRR